MIQSRLSRPDELGLRIDSPMREETRPGSTSSVRNLHGPTTPSHLSRPHELTSDGQTITIKYKMPHESPTSGFTAVNGDSQRNTSFRPDDSVQRSMNTQHVERGDLVPERTPVPPQVHSWRPSEPPTVPALPSDSESSPATKRKRSESDKDEIRQSVREERPTTAANELREQAAVAAGAPAAIATTTTPGRPTLPSISRSSQERSSTATAAGHYMREPSPVSMNDRGAPPSPPRPEIAAELSESLQRAVATGQDNQQYVPPAAHKSQQNVPPVAPDTRQYVSTTEYSGSPVHDTYGHNQSPAYESENGQQGGADGEDPNTKKRKRNFSNRTKTGCHTCRTRKKKCDENKPICHNCQRGNFDCGGYGAKPPGGTKISAVRPLTTIKPAYEPSHGPSQFSLGPYHDNRPRQPQPQYDSSSYGQQPPLRADQHVLPPVHHYNQPQAPPPAEYRPRDPYAVPYSEQPHYGDRYPPPHGLPPPPHPAEYPPGGMAPYHPYQDSTHLHHQSQNPKPNHHHTPPARPAPQTLPRYPPMDQYNGPPGPPTTISSKESGISTHSDGQRPRPGLVYRSGEKIARSKMITGEPCLYFTDKALISERSSCKGVLSSYNKADEPTSGVRVDEKSLIFSQLVNPKERKEYGFTWDGPIGAVGDRVVVQAPFSCEYGYNLNFSNETIIMRNCHFQDAATISIGSHVTVGPGCSFLTLVSPPGSGPHGQHSAGAIRVEDGCTIGGNVTILPFRTIGKGATVLAGSVVTKDVKPNTVVAGNPAKLVRGDDEVVEQENAKVLNEMQNGSWRRERFP